VDVTCWPVAPASLGGPVSIGGPIANTRLYIVDRYGNPVPAGVAGELWIGGIQVARGYWRRTELTAEKFVDDPFREGERVYKTGDLGRWLSDGTIEFIGRRDEQVKIRGYRIELGEIEQVLSGIGGVRSCCVVAREDKEGNKRLVGYVVLEENATLNKGALEQGLKGVLPEYMVPRWWVELAELPLTGSGKVDRKGLPAPELSVVGSNAYVAPRTRTEKLLVGIWQELLDVERVGIHDDFFELGGHSLLAMQLVSMIRSRMGKDVSIRKLFEYSILSKLAEQMEAKISIVNVENNHLIKLQPNGNATPIFIIPGTLGFCDGYFELAKAFGNDQPVIGITMYGYYNDEYAIEEVEKIAELNIRWIKSIRPSGPYTILGHSLGGVIAYEMMRQLQIEEDNSASCLILLDSPSELAPLAEDDIDSSLSALSVLARNNLGNYDFNEEKISHIKYSIQKELEENKASLDFEYLRAFLKRNGINFDVLENGSAEILYNLIKANGELKYTAEQDLRCDKILVVAEGGRLVHDKKGLNARWDQFLTNLKVLNSTGNHDSMITGSHAARIVELLNPIISQKFKNSI
jgi:thioesterase domain-containing protein